MNNAFKYFFDNWKRPIIFWVIVAAATIVFAVFQLMLQDELPILSNILFFAYLASMFGLLVSGIRQLYDKNRKNAILTTLTFGGSIVLFIFIIVAEFWIGQATPDKFTERLTIPQNIKVFEPKTELAELYGLMPDSMEKIKPQPFEFSIFNGVQPGIYDYGIWLGKIDSGTVYLKVYEVTKNTMLSSDEILRRSSIKVYNPTNKLRRFYTDKSFTVYEGDWGHPYAARFEVWYKSNTGRVKKLTEKNFKIEGWQR